MPTIPQKDADIILRKTAKFPTKGSQCNSACAFYFCCANGKDFEQCQGFLMLNGETKKLLEKNLGTDAVEYIKNSYDFVERAIANGNLEAVDVVVRDLSQLRERAEPETTDFAEAMRRGFSSIQGAVSPMAAPSLEEDAREKTYPETCTDGCKFVTCPYRKEENYGLPCKQRWLPLKRSLDPDNTEE
jgi:hypothetical protein